MSGLLIHRAVDRAFFSVVVEQVVCGLLVGMARHQAWFFGAHGESANGFQRLVACHPAWRQVVVGGFENRLSWDKALGFGLSCPVSIGSSLGCCVAGSVGEEGAFAILVNVALDRCFFAARGEGLS